MRYFVCIIIIAQSLGLTAHPSWGVTVGPDGTIYIADVLHQDGTLWQVDGDEVSPMFKNFHAHDVQYANGALWVAENLWVQGKIEGEGQHTLLRIDAYENIDTLIVTNKRSVFNGTNFAVSPQGDVYFENDARIYRLQKDKPGKLYIDKKFERVNSIKIDSQGHMWITEKNDEGGTLYRYDGTKLTPVASGIIDTEAGVPLFEEDHLQIMSGIGFDGEGNIYVCENSGCRIVKISPSGEKSTFYQSPLMWSPSGIHFYDGAAYIVETGFNKKHIGPRLLKKDKQGQVSRIARFDALPKKNPEEAIVRGYSLPAWIFFTIFLSLFTLLVFLSVKRQLQAGS